MMRSITLPYSGGIQIQVFIEQIESIYYNGLNTVYVGIKGNPQAVSVLVTDVIDANALIQQINDAVYSDIIVSSASGDPAVGGIPANPATTDEYGEIILDWDALASNYSYNIYRTETSGSGYVLVQNTTLPTFTDLNRLRDVTYYYVVTSVSPRGESAYSSEVSGVSLIPSTPTGLAVTPGYYSNDLTWDVVTGDAAFPSVSYFIYRDAVHVATAETNAFTDTGLNAGQLYSYTVSAVINSVEGDQCGAMTGTPTNLNVPTNLVDTPGYYSHVLTWDAVSGAETYNVYRSELSGGESIYATGITALTYTDVPVRSDRVYYYKVSAVTAGVEGGLSAEVSGQSNPATFSSYSPDPMTIIGGTLTFTGVGFDPNQAGIMVSTPTGVVMCSYIDATHFSIEVPGGISGADVKFAYIVDSGETELPFTVAFS